MKGKGARRTVCNTSRKVLHNVAQAAAPSLPCRSYRSMAACARLLIWSIRMLCQGSGMRLLVR